MKKLQITHIYDIAPSSLNDVAAGYNLGQWWENINTGDKYFHKTDGVWIKLLEEGDIPTSAPLGLIKIVDKYGEVFTDLATASAYIRTFTSATITNESYSNDTFWFTVPNGSSFSDDDNFLAPNPNTSAYIDDNLGLINDFANDAFYQNIGNNILGNCSFGDSSFVNSKGNNILGDCSFGEDSFYFSEGNNTLGNCVFDNFCFQAAKGIYKFKNILLLNSTDYFAYGASGRFEIYGTIGTTTGNDYANFFTINTAVIWVDKSMQTNNGGGIEGDLARAQTNGAKLFFGYADGGATDLSYTASPTDGTVTSSTGSGATLPLATTTFAGLLSPSEKIEIAKIADINTNAVDKVTVKLNEGVTKGQAVYATGASGTNILVSKASNTTEATSSKTLGLAFITGVTNDVINIVTNGLLDGLDTSSATIGDPVFLGVNGNLIYGTEPASPTHLIFIGFVTRVSATVGEIFIKIQNGYQLAQLHDLLLTGVTNNQVLQYETATQLWKNKTFDLSGYLTVDNPSYTGLLNGVGGIQTGSTAIGVINLAQTWNTTGAPSAFLMNITDTASSALSRLLDLKVGGAVRFQVTKNGVLSFGNFGTPVPAIGTAVPTTGAGSVGQTALYLGGAVGSAAGYQLFLTAQSGTRTATSGASGLVNIKEIFAPITGTGTYDTLTLNPTINQTGGANGVSRGLLVNPTITAAADFRAIESVNGKVILADTLTAVGGANAGGLLDLQQTWNTTGAPTAISLNVTNTASGTLAKLMELRVSSNTRFTITRDGFIYFGLFATTIPSMGTANSLTGSASAGGQAIYLGNTVGSGNGYGIHLTNQGSINRTTISGVNGTAMIRETFNPTSGTGTYDILTLGSTINQTGGANGITRGLRINPVLTSAADFRAIEVEAGKLVFSSTITAPGTTGAQTINKISGKVNAAAGTTSLVITNNLVTTNSIVMCDLGKNDATCIIKSVVEANGSFTINYVAPTAETVIKFFVIN